MPGFNIGPINNTESGTVADVNTRFYTSFSWEIPTLLEYSPENNYSSLSRDASNAVLMLKTATLPSLSFSKMEAAGGTTPYKFAGKPVYEDIRISWYDSVGMVDVMTNWIRSVMRGDGGINTPSVYKKTSKLKKFLADREQRSQREYGLQQESVEYVLYGSWPSLLKESDLTYTESAIKIVELTVTYDYYKMFKVTT